MMPFKKQEKYAKIVVFTERKEAKRDFSNVIFFENLWFWKTFISKSDALFNFQFKSWCVLFWIQSLTLCTVFVSKTGRMKSFIQKLTRGEVFDSKADFSFVLRF